MLRVGRIFEDVVAAIAVVDHIIAKPEVIFDHRGQRLNAVGVDFAELFDPAEDVVQFRHHAVDFVVAERQPGETRDVAHLICVYGHVGAASRTPPPLQRLFDGIADGLAINIKLAALDRPDFYGRTGEVGLLPP